MQPCYRVHNCMLSFYVSCFSHHCFFFFFNDTATTEIYTLSLHDALPISRYRERTIACTTCSSILRKRYATSGKKKLIESGSAVRSFRPCCSKHFDNCTSRMIARKSRCLASHWLIAGHPASRMKSEKTSSFDLCEASRGNISRCLSNSLQRDSPCLRLAPL